MQTKLLKKVRSGISIYKERGRDNSFVVEDRLYTNMDFKTNSEPLAKEFYYNSIQNHIDQLIIKKKKSKFIKIK